VKSKAGATGIIYQRFFDAAGNINLIQIAGIIFPAPVDVLNGSYSNRYVAGWHAGAGGELCGGEVRVRLRSWGCS